MPARVPTAIRAMLDNLKISTPESGYFKRRVLNQELLRKGVVSGRRLAIFYELERAGLLIDDRHFSTSRSQHQ